MQEELIQNLEGMVAIAQRLAASGSRRESNWGFDVLKAAKNLVDLYARIAGGDFDVQRIVFSDIIKGEHR